ncbi:hypothetical protein JCM16303_005774 [Sporobolomyces ruberrimus]
MQYGDNYHTTREYTLAGTLPANPSSSEDSAAAIDDYSTLTKLTRALMGLAGYPVPTQDIPVNLYENPTPTPTSIVVPSSSSTLEIVEEEEENSPSPSPIAKTKTSRTRGQSSIDWLPPPRSFVPPKPSFIEYEPEPTSSEEESVSSTEEEEEEEEFIEWIEPRSSKVWKGQMKRIESRRLSTILEEADEFTEAKRHDTRQKRGGGGGGERGRKKVGSKSSEGKKHERKRVREYLKVYKDEVLGRVRTSITLTDEEMEKRKDGRKRSEGVLEAVEGNEQRKRRKRSISLSRSSRESSASSEEESRERRSGKSFKEIEEETRAIERVFERRDLVWIEEVQDYLAGGGAAVGEGSALVDSEDEEEGEGEEGGGGGSDWASSSWRESGRE